MACNWIQVESGIDGRSFVFIFSTSFHSEWSRIWLKLNYVMEKDKLGSSWPILDRYGQLILDGNVCSIIPIFNTVAGCALKWKQFVLHI